MRNYGSRNMKKIILLIILIISAFSANAQMITVNDEWGREKTFFNVGDYSFKYVTDHRYTIHFDPIDGQEEARNLWRFIEKNKEKIEDKYNIVIDEIDVPLLTFTSENYSVINLIIYTDDEYEAKQAKIRHKEEERNNRMKSLQEIF